MGEQGTRRRARDAAIGVVVALLVGVGLVPLAASPAGATPGDVTSIAGGFLPYQGPVVPTMPVPADELSLTVYALQPISRGNHTYVRDYDNIYDVDRDAGTVRRIGGAGYGLGVDPATAVGQPATTIRSGWSRLFAVGPDGTVYFGSNDGSVIYGIDPETGLLEQVAGMGVPGFEGDTGPAIYAPINPAENTLFADDEGGLWFVQLVDLPALGSVPARLRRVDLATGQIDSVAGNDVSIWDVDGPGVETGVPATETPLPLVIATASDGATYALAAYESHRLLRFTPESGAWTDVVTDLPDACMYAPSTPFWLTASTLGCLDQVDQTRRTTVDLATGASSSDDVTGPMDAVFRGVDVDGTTRRPLISGRYDAPGDGSLLFPLQTQPGEAPYVVTIARWDGGDPGGPSTPTGTFVGYVGMVPGADDHRVDLLLDGVPVGTGLGNGESTAPIPVPVGPHTMSVAPSGDIDLSHYIIVFWGNCNADGTMTVVEGGLTACAPILVHPSIPVPNLTISEPVVTRPATGSAVASFTVSMKGGAFFPVSVDFATHDGTATVAAGDYTATSGTLSFPAGGEASQVVNVPVSSTSRHGSVDTFDLVLSNPVAATLGDASGTAHLINRLGPFSVYARDTGVVRSTSATTTASFIIALSAPPEPGESVTALVHTADGTATAPSDYTSVTASVSFGPGQTSATVDVPVAPKPAGSPTRTLDLVIDAVSADAVIGDATASATLRSAGSPAPPIPIYVSDVMRLRTGSGSAPATFTVKLGARPSAPVTVDYATHDGTATQAAGDFLGTAGTLSFAAGETSKTVTVSTFPTAGHGADDRFTLVLSSPAGAVLADDTGVARLINRWAPLAVSIADRAAVRSVSAAGQVDVTVALAEPTGPGETVTLELTTEDLTAVGGVDYTPVSTTVTFSPGQREAVVTIAFASVADGTPRRDLRVVLSSPSANALIADASAVVALIGP